MERRRLGRTGHMSSVVTFGAAGIGRVPQEVADHALEAGRIGKVYGVAVSASRPGAVSRRGVLRGCIPLLRVIVQIPILTVRLKPDTTTATVRSVRLQAEPSSCLAIVCSCRLEVPS